MFHGVPGKPGCMVLMYKCEECNSVPVSDLCWSVTKGHGKGSGWWCTKCGHMWDGNKQGSYLLGIQVDVAVDSVQYFQTTPPPQECASFIEVRKLATNCINLNLPLTVKATSPEFAQQCVALVKRDNKLQSFSTPDLLKCVVNARTMGPLYDLTKWLPNYRLVEDDSNFTLKSTDWGREEQYYDLSRLPAEKQHQFMAESEWFAICNLVFDTLTIAESTGYGCSIEVETSLVGNGKKAKMSRDIMSAVSIKKTGCYPRHLGGQPASPADKSWAKDYTPCCT
jgi:hypothetical protein